MDILIGVIVGLLVLMVLVVAHEFGHFIAARRNGVNVLEFGIGFPPRAVAWIKDSKTGKWRRLPRSEWKKDRLTKVVYSDSKKTELAQKGMIFSLNFLPIGGFCQMDGESAVDTRKGTFGKASFWAKTKILFAGVMMNWLVAFVILTILAWTGMPDFLNNQFTIPIDTRTEAGKVEIMAVAEDSPAAKAGLLKNDYIVKVGGEEIFRTGDVINYNESHAGTEADYTILRKISVCPDEATECEDSQKIQREETLELKAKLNDKNSNYLLGVSLAGTQGLSYSTWSAPIVGAGLTLQMTGETFAGVGKLVWNLVSGALSQFNFDGEVRESGREAISEVGDSVSGPVGIVGVLFPAFTAAGPANLAFLAALISVSLACMNVLPIPALDGGRWLLIAIYKIRHKKLSKETEEKIVARAFVVLLALFFIVTVLDIMRLAR